MTANASAQEAITVLKTIRLQRFKEAVVALEQARQLEPNSSETSLNLGYAYAKQKRYREAIAEMQKAVRLNPNDEQTQLRLCNFYLLAKDRQAALAQIETVKSTNPELTQKLCRILYSDKVVIVSDK